ncbi:hypothetical protein [Hymenobacter jejuensis]|uniref:Uncharacterized protein n=1 Tax=Hymenobacter jejuensis TaxID=2502781 RepID=A0A5B7ZVW2_9BACT|nr:hypothetical protein [Hymenobacter jejuensis]QDA59261.1 hypothetical protein FHG12_03680 [Hymenobacter jejuensis]
MIARLLSDDEFQQTFCDPMQNVTESADPQLDIWPYVDAITPNDLNGHIIENGIVELVYRSGDQRFDHVLIPAKKPNVFLVIVVDLSCNLVHGHLILDLRESYGIP